MKKTIWMLTIAIFLLSFAGCAAAMGVFGGFETGRYGSYTGTVVGVIQGDTLVVTLEDANGELASFVITEEAYWMDGATLAEGEQLEIFYELLPFTPAIFPLQHVAATIAPVMDEEHDSRSQQNQTKKPTVDSKLTPSLENTPDEIMPMKSNETSPKPSTESDYTSPVSLLYTFPDTLPPLD